MQQKALKGTKKVDALERERGIGRERYGFKKVVNIRDDLHMNSVDKYNIHKNMKR